MRRNWLFLLGWAALLPMTFGCRQTTGTSSLTPIGPLGTVGPLAPVGGGTAAASLSPLGQPTRVPPPATGSYSTPNNYMGGAPVGGQVSVQPAPYDSFSAVAPPQRNAIGSGVAPTTFIDPVGPGDFSSGARNAGQSPMSPNLDGMRVIDMTQAPPPPGYRPSFPTQSYPEVNPQAFGSGNGAGNAFGTYQPPYDVPPQTFGGSQPGNFNPQVPTIQIPRSRDIASGQFGAGQFDSGAQFGTGASAGPTGGPSTSIARREFPMQPSLTEPSFQGGSQFPSSQPSTEPVENSFERQQRNLPWRRPGTQY